jgi:hypothetical protein
LAINSENRQIMRDSGTDEPAAAAEPNSHQLPMSAEFATQLATLAGDETPFRQAELPLWSRLTRPAKRVTWDSRLLAGLVWCVAIGLLAVAAMRIADQERWVLLTWLNAFALCLYLPAYRVLAFAAWTKRLWKSPPDRSPVEGTFPGRLDLPGRRMISYRLVASPRIHSIVS